MIGLRPYQARDLDRLREALRRHPRVLYTAPTGSGKTVLFSAIAHGVAQKGKRAVILVHRRELVRQTAVKLAAFGVPHGLLVAGRPGDLAATVTVAAVQTLGRRLAASKGLDLAADLVVIDEAHHAVAGTWRWVLEAFPRARVLGVTATPERLDGTGLEDVFDHLVDGPTVRELHEGGYLAPFTVYARRGAELSLRRARGDFRTDDLETAMMPAAVTDAASATTARSCPGSRRSSSPSRCVTPRRWPRPSAPPASPQRRSTAAWASPSATASSAASPPASCG